jgi:hypothetical protein
MIKDFLWKFIDIDINAIRDIQDQYINKLPNNNYFFQQLNLDISTFLGLEVQRFVLIQVDPNAIGRIHTDWRPSGYGDCLALNIPLFNCENSVTELWKSSYDPPVQYTTNGQPYRYFDPKLCEKISEFSLIKPVLFRTDVPHSVSNRSNKIRQAISIRFKEDPWHLI